MDWLPRSVLVELACFGRIMRFRVPIDVDEVQTFVPTWFHVEPQPNLVQAAAALASWRRSDGSSGIGVVTAGHGCWSRGASGKFARSQTARVKLADGSIVAGSVVAASLIGRDPVDVALVEVPAVSQAGQAFAKSPKSLIDATVPDVSEYARLLGGIGDPLKLSAFFRTGSGGSNRCIAVAWYSKLPVQVKGFGLVNLEGVVETRAPAGTFASGTSGAAIASLSSPAVPLGIQSLARDVEGEHQSYATDFRAAELWLRDNVHPSLRLHWG